MQRERLRLSLSPEGATASRPPSDWSHGVACPAFAGTVPKGTNQTPVRVCGRLRLCCCPKGAAASREGSGINASGDAEAKEVASKMKNWAERQKLSLVPGNRCGRARNGDTLSPQCDFSFDTVCSLC
jgi:hypothetical protein